MLATAPRIVSSFHWQPPLSIQIPYSSSHMRLPSIYHMASTKTWPYITHLCCSSSDQVEFPLSEAEDLDIELEAMRKDGFEIQVEKVEGRKNTRRINAQVRINAHLETIWSVLTNYEGLADFIPGLAVSQLLHYDNKCARVYQVGQQELAIGLKFSAKGVIECYENDMVSVSASCRKRAIDFKMVEGDFKTFKGQWCIEQVCDETEEEEALKSVIRGYQTKLLYNVEVEPKLMVPVQLIEGRLRREVEINLLSVREEAHRLQRLNGTFLC